MDKNRRIRLKGCGLVASNPLYFPLTMISTYFWERNACLFPHHLPIVKFEAKKQLGRIDNQSCCITSLSCGFIHSIRSSAGNDVTQIGADTEDDPHPAQALQKLPRYSLSQLGKPKPPHSASS